MDDAALTRYRRDHVGFVFQFYNLMPSLTARENVELVTEIADDPMDPARRSALVGLKERADHFPAQLSGGEQQRVAIARAVAKRPEVLFCDEPTGALDSTTGRAVLEVLADVNEPLGTTVLMVTHAAATAAMADRVIHFADGGIREVGGERDQSRPAGDRLVSPLDRKLLRDLWRIRGQAVAIGAVIAVGVMMLVMMTGLVASLTETRAPITSAIGWPTSSPRWRARPSGWSPAGRAARRRGGARAGSRAAR